MRETNRTTFVFFFSILNLKHSILDKFHHLHQLFYVKIPYLNPGIEMKNHIHIFYAEKSRDLTLIFKHWWVIPFFVKFLVEVHGFESTGYMVSSSGYMVLEVRNTWFREYWVLRVPGCKVCNFSLFASWLANSNSLAKWLRSVRQVIQSIVYSTFHLQVFRNWVVTEDRSRLLIFITLSLTLTS